MAAVKSRSVRANGRAAVHSRGQSASNPRPRLHYVQSLSGAVGAPMVNQLCPLHWPGNVRNAATTRLRHFPRKSLIARLSSGEASIVIGGSRQALWRNDLDDAQRAIQSKGDSREASVNPARMRTGHGDGQFANTG